MRASRWSRLVYTALFTALTTVATLVIQVPSPMSGYVNLGDAMVLLSAWILGPVYGTAAAGIGSMLADLLSGYAYYAPGTLIIKCLMAFVAAQVFFVGPPMRYIVTSVVRKQIKTAAQNGEKRRYTSGR